MLRTGSIGRLPHLTVVLLNYVLLAAPPGTSWDKVRYSEGTLPIRINPQDWDNRLEVTSGLVILTPRQAETQTIPTNSITALSYGQEAHLRVTNLLSMRTPAVSVAVLDPNGSAEPHFIGLEYETSEKKRAAILLEGHEDNYRAILLALGRATGLSFAVSEAERRYLPVGVERSPTSSLGGNAKAAATANAAAGTEIPDMGTLTVTSSPIGSLVSVDGEAFSGTPVALRLPVGKHSIRLSLSGYKDCTKQITLLSGSEEKVEVVLEREEPKNQ
jgi:hypothetical protein